MHSCPAMSSTLPLQSSSRALQLSAVGSLGMHAGSAPAAAHVSTPVAQTPGLPLLHGAPRPGMSSSDPSQSSSAPELLQLSVEGPIAPSQVDAHLPLSHGCMPGLHCP